MSSDKPRRFYIYRVTITREDGTTRSGLVKTTSLAHEPGASVYGLFAELADLQRDGRVRKSTVSIPATITPRQRAKLGRWPEILPALIGGAA